MRPTTNIALLPVSDDLDVTNVGRLRADIDSLINRGCRRIVLNMAGCGYVDSAGMGLLFSEIRHMHAHGGLLSFINVSQPIMRMFRICRIVDFAPVSMAGPRPEVAALDPTVQPEWRSSYKVNPCNMAQTREYVSTMLERCSLTDDQRFDMNLAIGEAMGNAVDHAEGSSAVVTLVGYSDRVIAEITDRGCGFERDCTGEGAGDAEDPCGCDGAPAERGRGIKLMCLLADSVQIKKRQSGGTLVRIVKLYGSQG